LSLIHIVVLSYNLEAQDVLLVAVDDDAVEDEERSVKGEENPVQLT